MVIRQCWVCTLISTQCTALKSHQKVQTQLFSPKILCEEASPSELNHGPRTRSSHYDIVPFSANRQIWFSEILLLQTFDTASILMFALIYSHLRWVTKKKHLISVANGLFVALSFLPVWESHSNLFDGSPKIFIFDSRRKWDDIYIRFIRYVSMNACKYVCKYVCVAFYGFPLDFHRFRGWFSYQAMFSESVSTMICKTIHSF